MEKYNDNIDVKTDETQDESSDPIQELNKKLFMKKDLKGEKYEKLDIETIRQMLPTKVRKNLTQDMVDSINFINVDTEYAQFFRDNLLTYMTVIQDGRFKIKDYLFAVKYVTFKLIGDTNKSAYVKTFPERYKRMVDEGRDDKYINYMVSAYNKGTIVSKIFEKNIVVTSIVYRDLFHESIMVQADLMRTARSETVKQKASATLIENLKPNEESKIEIDMSIKDSDDIVKRYENALDFASKRMMEGMKNGGDIKDIVNTKLSAPKIENIVDADIVQKDSNE